MLQDTLTPGERNLIEHGHSDEVEALRKAYQAVLRDGAVEMIEEVTQRRVVGFMGANHFNPDMAAEVFILDPDEEPRTQTPQESPLFST